MVPGCFQVFVVHVFLLEVLWQVVHFLILFAVFAKGSVAVELNDSSHWSGNIYSRNLLVVHVSGSY